MLIVRPVWKIAAHLAVADDVFMASFCAVIYSHEMSRMESGTYLGQFLL